MRSRGVTRERRVGTAPARDSREYRRSIAAPRDPTPHTARIVAGARGSRQGTGARRVAGRALEASQQPRTHLLAVALWFGHAGQHEHKRALVLSAQPAARHGGVNTPEPQVSTHATQTHARRQSQRAAFTRLDRWLYAVRRGARGEGRVSTVCPFSSARACPAGRLAARHTAARVRERRHGGGPPRRALAARPALTAGAAPALLRLLLVPALRTRRQQRGQQAVAWRRLRPLAQGLGALGGDGRRGSAAPRKRGDRARPSRAAPRAPCAGRPSKAFSLSRDGSLSALQAPLPFLSLFSGSQRSRRTKVPEARSACASAGEGAERGRAWLNAPALRAATRVPPSSSPTTHRQG